MSVEAVPIRHSRRARSPLSVHCRRVAWEPPCDGHWHLWIVIVAATRTRPILLRVSNFMPHERLLRVRRRLNSLSSSSSSSSSWRKMILFHCDVGRDSRLVWIVERNRHFGSRPKQSCSCRRRQGLMRLSWSLPTVMSYHHYENARTHTYRVSCVAEVIVATTRVRRQDRVSPRA